VAVLDAFDLWGKAAFVTGCTTELGEALANALGEASEERM
jgi:NAD(P)-dependent dehydrogenase (short-subunit alcohol dehydrogenase family)